jgi:hypothetical protein
VLTGVLENDIVSLKFEAGDRIFLCGSILPFSVLEPGKPGSGCFL